LRRRRDQAPGHGTIFDQARRSFGAVRGVVDIVAWPKLAPLSAFSDADYEWQFDGRPPDASLPCRSARPGRRKVARGRDSAFVGSISGIACLPNK